MNKADYYREQAKIANANMKQAIYYGGPKFMAIADQQMRDEAEYLRLSALENEGLA